MARLTPLAAGESGSGRSAGFTLIGQLTTLAIVGILCTIAVVSYRDIMPRVRLEGAARQIVADLMFARMKAVRDQRRHRVVFLSAENYQVLAEDDEGAWLPALVRNLPSGYPGVALIANDAPVFTPGGRASVLATIRVGNESGERRVSVNVTGRVKMQ